MEQVGSEEKLLGLIAFYQLEGFPEERMDDRFYLLIANMIGLISKDIPERKYLVPRYEVEEEPDNEKEIELRKQVESAKILAYHRKMDRFFKERDGSKHSQGKHCVKR